MSIRCKHVQEALAAAAAVEVGADALLQKHLSACADCSELRAALVMLDELLRSMPPLDPPGKLVDRMLADLGSNAPTVQLVDNGPGRLEVAKGSTSALDGETRAGRVLAIGGALAAAAAVVFMLASSLMASSQDESSPALDQRAATATPTIVPPATIALNSPGFNDELAAGKNDTGVEPSANGIFGTFSVDGSQSISGEAKSGGDGDDAGRGTERLAALEEAGRSTRYFGRDQADNTAADDERRQEGERLQQAAQKNDVGGRWSEPFEQDQTRGPATTAKPRLPQSAVDSGKHQVTLRTPAIGEAVRTDEPAKTESAKDEKTVATSAPSSVESKLGKLTVKGDTDDRGLQSEDKRFAWRLSVEDSTGYRDSVDDANGESSGEPFHAALGEADGKRSASSPRQQAARERANEVTKPTGGTRGLKQENEERAESALEVNLPKRASDAHAEQAHAFVAERSKYLGVPTVTANGFWSNNYIPGDPRLRLLAARLASDPNSHRIGSLDASVAPYPQSFDAPKNSALAVSVRSDRRAADGPARMLLQVGLQGTARQAGGRPALNIGVVLDLGGTADDATNEPATAMRGLLSALRAAKRRGDRFSLTVANRPGGLLLTPDQFRNGPLRVAMQTLFSSKSSESSQRETLGLAAAVRAATAQVAATDDTSGPLGRSMVVVVTASSSPSAVDRKLEELAHANATRGIGLSTIGIGTAIDDDQLLRWAAAGHGNRRLVVRAGDAKRVVASELASVEAVVARALRVRVKLASGVKLVEVVGAKRLSAATAARTREAEKSIDRRVAKARGIASDRERDEDGVKVMIPSFSAGDSHVILLDVIADGPGALADVTVTYKDLVHLRNGSAKSSLSLKRGRHQTGHLERSVFRNYIGQVISQRLARAGSLLATDDDASAARVITELYDLLLGLRIERPRLRNDPAFARDVATVDKFLGVVRGGVSDAAKAYIANSLSYAAWRKLVRVRRETN